MSTRSGRLARSLLATVAALAPGCGCKGEPAATTRSSQAYGRPAAPPPPSPGPAAPLPRFEDAAGAMGVRFLHENGARGKKYLPETLGSGCAVLDFDGDGRMDLFLVNSMPWPGEEGAAGAPPTARLFRNRGDGTFEDATAASGLGEARFGLGVAAADYDGDGDTDLFLTAVGPCALYRNDGGKFTEVAAAAGVAGEPWTDEEGASHDPVWSAAAFLDYDGDGVLDLYACRYVRWCREGDIFTSLDGRTKAYTVPDRYRGDSGRLYRGRGDGTFEDATDAAGMRNDDAKALGVIACDLDGDGLTDVMVANDTQPNHLYRNRGDGTFEEIGLQAGVAYDAAGRARADMGVDAAQVDDAGSPVIVTGTFSQEAVAFYRRRPTSRTLAYADDGVVSGVAGPTFPYLAFGVLFQDLDLDGRLDLVIANGHIEPTIQEVQSGTSYAETPQFLRNVGNGRFEDVSASAGPAFGNPCVGRGLAWGDFDSDGDPDLVISCNGAAARILRNTAPPGHRSLRVRLEGTGRNRDALGAVVAVTAGGRTLSRERTSGGSYCSASEPTLLFGLGTSPAAEKVTVRWPGREGKTDDLGPLAAGLWRVRPGQPPVRLGD